ncbi:hypothetical protein [Hymenobacter bucti]|uniref:DUF4760 domain-containing protein n=1 Tax=Hymenobacter bucti TaxID=1844114 RepID=A0ABW4QXI7_9BACT
MTIEDKDIPSLLVSVVAFVVASLGTVYSIYYSAKSHKSKVLFEVFTEFRQAKFIEARTLLTTLGTGSSTMNFEPFREYTFLLNHIGMLLHKGYIDVDEIYQMAGRSIIDAWRILSPKILALRQESDKRKYYQFHFQYLVAQLLEHQKFGEENVALFIADSAEKIRIYSLPERRTL